jgi:hypothetical protein
VYRKPDGVDKVLEFSGATLCETSLSVEDWLFKVGTAKGDVPVAGTSGAAGVSLFVSMLTCCGLGQLVRSKRLLGVLRDHSVESGRSLEDQGFSRWNRPVG